MDEQIGIAGCPMPNKAFVESNDGKVYITDYNRLRRAAGELVNALKAIGERCPNGVVHPGEISVGEMARNALGRYAKAIS